MIIVGSSSIGASLLRSISARARRVINISGLDIEVVAEHTRDKRYWQKYTIYIKAASPLSDEFKEIARQAVMETRGARDDARLIIHSGDPDSPLYEETFT